MHGGRTFSGARLHQERLSAPDISGFHAIGRAIGRRKSYARGKICKWCDKVALYWFGKQFACREHKDRIEIPPFTMSGAGEL